MPTRVKGREEKAPISSEATRLTMRYHAQMSGGQQRGEPLSLEACYAALLEGYILVLAKLPRRPIPLLRVYVEVHIRRQLMHAAKWFVYRQSHISHDSSKDAPKDAWLVSAKAKTDQFVSTLDAASGVGRIARLAVAITPPAVATVYALFGPPSSSSSSSHGNEPDKAKSLIDLLPHLSVFQVSLLISALAYVLGIGAWVFSIKRKLFKGVSVGGRNIYGIEDSLFQRIGVPKIREFPLDCFLSLFFSLGLLFSVIILAPKFDWLLVSSFAAIYLILVTIIICFWLLRKDR